MRASPKAIHKYLRDRHQVLWSRRIDNEHARVSPLYRESIADFTFTASWMSPGFQKPISNWRQAIDEALRLPSIRDNTQPLSGYAQRGDRPCWYVYDPVIFFLFFGQVEEVLDRLRMLEIMAP